MKPTADQIEQLKRESDFARMGQQVLDNAAFQQAMITRKAQVFDIFCESGMDQSDVREKAYLTMINMIAFEEFFRSAMETGRMADTSLELMNKEE